MAGIYIHIPFCSKACHYCDFHFSTQTQHIAPLINAICKEIEIQKHYLDKQKIKTIYLGGGTPSVLQNMYIDKLFDTLSKHYHLADVQEITIEANPEDISREKLIFYKNFNINRLSIGIQSFNDDVLQWMNRAHNGNVAAKSIETAQDAGFEHLSVDLMYGLPESTGHVFEDDLEKISSYGIPHLSCYHFTIEKETVFGTLHQKNKLYPKHETLSVQEFNTLINFAQRKGYEHYEISNFALPGHESLHNSAYWFGEPYLGVGPSAHSYNGTSRAYNVANNHLYMEEICHGRLAQSIEILTPLNLQNEYTLTRLRHKNGLKKTEIDQFVHFEKEHYYKTLQKFVHSGHILEQQERYTLSTEGKLIADHIISSLFCTNV